MKLHLSSHGSRRGGLAFTFVEVMIAMSIFTFVVGALIYTHLMGLQLNEWTARKLGASDFARKAFINLQDDIRSATTLQVGTGNATTFTEAADGTAQQGQALQIYPTTATTNWSRYYFDTTANELRLVTSSSSTPQTLAKYLTNIVVFKAEDYSGNVLTSIANNRVINITLQFYQLEYPVTKIGPSNAYDFYQLQAKITRRIL